MDIEAIFNEGGVTIPNPNYNKRKKNNTEPEYILSKNPNDRPNTTAGALYNSASDFWVMGDTQKYQDYGISPRPGLDLDKEIADKQNGWVKMFNAIGQTLVSEIGLGTLKGFSDLFGFIGEKLGLLDEDYTNPISEGLGKAQDWFNEEVMPVYADPSLNISNGGLGDVGWWAKNIPSIASSLTLMLPSRGVSMGLSKLGKAANLGAKTTRARQWLTGIGKLNAAKEINSIKDLNKVQRFLNNTKTIERFNAGVKLTGEALMMRTMENYQEAHDVHAQTYQSALDKFRDMSDEKYQEFINNNKDMLSDVDTSDKDAVAKAIAKKAADKTFGMDFANVIFDAIQLYSLGNIGKGVKNVSKGAVKQTQRKSLEELKELPSKIAADAGKAAKVTKEAAEEVAKAAKPNIFKKSIKGFKNVAHDYGMIALEESTEGIEEAVNYIAQQEGITYGKMLLEGKGKDEQHGGFLNTMVDAANVWLHPYKTFKDYMSSPEMWESAFWGVMGGLVFGGVGSSINKRQAANRYKKEREKLKEQGYELPEEDDNFINLTDMEDIKAAKIAIGNNNRILEEYIRERNLIKQGYDIFAPTNTDGTYREFQGDEETKKLRQAQAMAELTQSFRTDLASKNIAAGTYNQLVDYFNSEPMRQAAVELGLVDEEDVDNYINETLADFEDAKNTYREQAVLLNNQATAINASGKFKFLIPSEYINIIAKQNTDLILSSKSVDRQIALLNSRTAEQEQAIINNLATDEEKADKRNELNRAKEVRSISRLADIYSRLEADKEYIKEHVENGLDKRIALSQVESQQQGIATQLRKFNNSHAVMLSTIKLAHTYEKYEEKGEDETSTFHYKLKSNEEFFKKGDDEIIREYEKIIRNDDKHFTQDELDNVILNSTKLDEEIDKFISDESVLAEHETLADNYDQITVLEFKKYNALKQLATTKNQVIDQLDAIHTRLNEARLAAVKKADTIFRNLFNKYKETNVDGVEEAIYAAVKENPIEGRRIIEEFMSSEDVEDFMSALDVFKFSHASNIAILKDVIAQIENQKEIDKRREKSSTKNQNQNIDAENQQTENTTSVVQNPLESDKKRQKSNNSQSKDPHRNLETAFDNIANNGENQQDDSIVQGTQTKIALTIDKNGKVIVGRERKKQGRFKRPLLNIIKLNDTSEDEHYTVDLANTPYEDLVSYVGTELFNHNTDNGVDILNENTKLEVTQAPIFVKQNGEFKLVKAGEVIAVDISSPIEESEESSESKSTLPSTGELKQPETLQAELAKEPEAAKESITELDGYTDKEKVQGFIGAILNKYVEAKRISNPNLFDANLNIDEFEQHLLNIDIIKNSPSLTKEAKRQMSDVKRLREQFVNLNTVDKAGATLGMASKLLDLSNKKQALFFTSAAEAFLDEYKKLVRLPIVNGKQLIRLSDILQLCNNAFGETSDISVARSMYNVVKNYLTNDPFAKEQYEIIDKDDINANRVLTKISQTKEERRAAHEQNTPVRAIMREIWDVVTDDNFPKEEKDKFEKAYETLKPGDKLQIVSLEGTVYDKYESSRLGLAKDGIVIGFYPKTNIDPNGNMRYVTKGWVARFDNDGNSPLKDYFIRLLTEDSKEAEAFRSLLYYYDVAKQAGNLTDTNIENVILDKFKNNPIIKEIIDSSIGKNNYNNLIFSEDGEPIITLDLIDHLNNLLHYVTDVTISSDPEVNKNNVVDSINKWFDNLFNELNVGWTMNDDSNHNWSLLNTGVVEGVYATVDVISGGVLVPNVKASEKEVSYDDCLPMSEALSEKTKAKLSFAQSAKTVVVAGEGNMEYVENAYTPNSTMLTVFNEVGTPIHTGLFGLRLTDNVFKSNDFLQNLLRDSLAELQIALGSRQEDSIEKTLKCLVNISGTRTVKGFIPTPILRSIDNVSISFADNVNVGEGRAIGLKILDKRGDKPITTFFNIFTKSPKYGTDILGYSISEKIGDVTGVNVVVKEQLYNGSKVDISTVRDKIAQRLYDILKQNTSVNIDFKAIREDSNPTAYQSQGYIRRVDGKIEVGVPGRKTNATFDNYSDYIIKSNLAKVNLKKNKKGDNFEKFSKDAMPLNHIFVSLHTTENKSIKPKKETKSDYVHLDDNDNIVVERMNHIRNIIDSNKSNPISDIISSVFDEDEQDAFNQVVNESLPLYDLFPTIIDYNNDLNGFRSTKKGKPKEWVGSVAWSRGTGAGRYRLQRTKKLADSPENERPTVPKGHVVVGAQWLNAIASNDKGKRNAGITTLVHEQVHNKFAEQPKNKREKITKGLYFLYETVKTVLDNEDYKTLGISEKDVEYFNNSIGSYKDHNTIAEELLAESLTSKHVYTILNNIKTQTNNIENKETIFDKILNFIRTLFGWEKIKDSSVLKRELEIIRDSINSDIKLDNNSPVEESNKKLEPTPESETNNEEEEYDDEEEEYDDVDDYDGLGNEQRILSLDYEIATNNKTNIPDKDGYVAAKDSKERINKLPPEAKASYKQALDDGIYEIKCKI